MALTLYVKKSLVKLIRGSNRLQEEKFLFKDMIEVD